MSNVIYMPAYTVKELNEIGYCPLGDWMLISEDRMDVLARFYNADFLLSQPQGLALTTDTGQGSLVTVLVAA